MDVLHIMSLMQLYLLHLFNFEILRDPRNTFSMSWYFYAGQDMNLKLSGYDCLALKKESMKYEHSK